MVRQTTAGYTRPEVIDYGGQGSDGAKIDQGRGADSLVAVAKHMRDGDGGAAIVVDSAEVTGWCLIGT